MPTPNRGILYIVWGEKAERLLQRSIQSLRQFHPDIPIHIVRGTANDGLMQKSRMGSLTPFETTLYLDADTLVLGNLDYAFDRAQQFGLACSMCECPWLRRYGAEHGDQTEYNTGVLFFTPAARELFSTWQRSAPTTPSRSRWLNPAGETFGMDYDDQASFALSIKEHNFNPHVLPMNWNYRPEFQPRVFAPVKIWHHHLDPPPQFTTLNNACRAGARPISSIDLFPG